MATLLCPEDEALSLETTPESTGFLPCLLVSVAGVHKRRERAACRKCIDLLVLTPKLGTWVEFNTTFVMYNEDHTLGNALRMMLNQNPKVRYVRLSELLRATMVTPDYVRACEQREVPRVCGIGVHACRRMSACVSLRHTTWVTFFLPGKFWVGTSPTGIACAVCACCFAQSMTK